MLNSVRAIYFPYCLRQRKDKFWVILNRNYKPVGTLDEDWSNYETLPVDKCIKSISPDEAAHLSYSGCTDNAFSIYLYNDECSPTLSKANMKSYLARIEILMHLETNGLNS